jgi:hypothetical protein
MTLLTATGRDLPAAPGVSVRESKITFPPGFVFPS